MSKDLAALCFIDYDTMLVREDKRQNRRYGVMYEMFNQNENGSIKNGNHNDEQYDYKQNPLTNEEFLDVILNSMNSEN
jgi:hypothetical protein